MSWKPSLQTRVWRQPSSMFQQLEGKGLPVISSQPLVVRAVEEGFEGAAGLSRESGGRREGELGEGTAGQGCLR
jgi:hypothetical protein